jgi:hypothetical protein
MDASSQALDRNGNVVSVGTAVRVVAIPQSVFRDLAPEEAADVESMRGEVFSVYEIDQWGHAWVKKWWRIAEDQSYSHSLALAPNEMEVVQGANGDA